MPAAASSGDEHHPDCYERQIRRTGDDCVLVQDIGHSGRGCVELMLL